MNNDPFAPQEAKFINFGEIVFYEHFDGVWLSGQKQPEQYDATNQAHQGRRKNHYFKIQFFPQKSQFESFPNFWQNTSKEWELFYTTLQGACDGQNISAFLQEAVDKQKPFYASWESVPTRKYTSKSTGEEKQVYGTKILALYAGQSEMLAAYDEHFGIDGEPDTIPGFDGVNGPKPDALPLDQALGFVEALARQCANENGVVDLVQLQEKIDSMPLLGNLVAESSEVCNKINSIAGLSTLPF